MGEGSTAHSANVIGFLVNTTQYLYLFCGQAQRSQHHSHPCLAALASHDAACLYPSRLGRRARKGGAGSGRTAFDAVHPLSANVLGAHPMGTSRLYLRR